MLTKMFVSNPSDPVSTSTNISKCHFLYRLSSCKRTFATTMAADPPSTSTRGWSWTSCAIKSKNLAASCHKARTRTQLRTRRQPSLTQIGPQMAARVRMTMCSTFPSRRSRGIMLIANPEHPSALKLSATGTGRRSSRRPFIQRAMS